ncbi:MAG: hypothetical protein KBA61_04815 [Spirochaetes bacterium]|nr:hypothetical protein [Spirochaetota bacterium]
MIITAADIIALAKKRRWAILLGLAFVLHAVVQGMILFSSDMAFGSDGYYYAAQVRYYLLHGHFFSPESSPVLYLMVGASRLWNDIVVTNKLVILLLSSIMVFPLYFTGKKLRDESAGMALALLGAFNSMLCEFSFEYVKNLGGIVAFMFLIWMAAVLFVDGAKHRNLACLAVSLLITFFAHKLMAVIGLLFCLVFFLPVISRRKALILGLGSLAIILPLLTLLFPNLINPADFSRISSVFSAAPNFPPASYYKISPIGRWQLPEIALWVSAPALLLIAHLKRRSSMSRFSLYLLPVYLVAMFPFMHFNSPDMAYRLFILIFIPGAFAAASFVPEIRAAFVPPLLVLFSLYHYNAMLKFRGAMQHDYRLYATLLPMIQLPANSLLIVHQGFDYFYCYSGKGDSFHFLPEPKHAGRPVYRLAYGIAPEEVRTRLLGKDVTELPGGYTLMKEEDWNSFIGSISAERKISLLARRNPHLPRPDYMKRNDRFLGK